MKEATAEITAADLRAERARQQVKLYDLAPRVGVHPADLGAMLNGRRPLRPDVARRVHDALGAMVQERANAT